jgi:hypothetical protein
MLETMTREAIRLAPSEVQTGMKVTEDLPSVSTACF